MAVSRFNNRKVLNNSNSSYALSDILKKRGIRTIEQFLTARLNYPDINEIANLQVATEVWTVGTKYFKLAKKYYGSEEYWWVIAWYNGYPTEFDVRKGDILTIPLNLEKALIALGVY